MGGEISIVPEWSHHGHSFPACEASKGRVGVGENLVLGVWENDLAIICELSTKILPVSSQGERQSSLGQLLRGVTPEGLCG